MQQPLARKHVAHCRNQRRHLVQASASCVRKHTPARDDDMHDYEPAHRRADSLFRKQIEGPMKRVVGRYLYIVDERHSAEAIWIPERNLTSLLPRADQKSLKRQMHCQKIGMVRVKVPGRVQNEIAEED